MTSITWASPRYVQELTTVLGPQNRTQGSCVLLIKYYVLVYTFVVYIYDFISVHNFGQQIMNCKKQLVY